MNEYETSLPTSPKGTMKSPLKSDVAFEARGSSNLMRSPSFYSSPRKASLKMDKGWLNLRKRAMQPLQHSVSLLPDSRADRYLTRRQPGTVILRVCGVDQMDVEDGRAKKGKLAISYKLRSTVHHLPLDIPVRVRSSSSLASRDKLNKTFVDPPEESFQALFSKSKLRKLSDLITKCLPLLEQMLQDLVKSEYFVDADVSALDLSECLAGKSVLYCRGGAAHRFLLCQTSSTAQARVQNSESSEALQSISSQVNSSWLQFMPDGSIQSPKGNVSSLAQATQDFLGYIPAVSSFADSQTAKIGSSASVMQGNSHHETPVDYTVDLALNDNRTILVTEGDMDQNQLLIALKAAAQSNRMAERDAAAKTVLELVQGSMGKAEAAQPEVWQHLISALCTELSPQSSQMLVQAASHLHALSSTRYEQGSPRPNEKAASVTSNSSSSTLSFMGGLLTTRLSTARSQQANGGKRQQAMLPVIVGIHALLMESKGIAQAIGPHSRLRAMLLQVLQSCQLLSERRILPVPSADFPGFPKVELPTDRDFGVFAGGQSVRTDRSAIARPPLPPIAPPVTGRRSKQTYSAQGALAGIMANHAGSDSTLTSVDSSSGPAKQTTIGSPPRVHSKLPPLRLPSPRRTQTPAPVVLETVSPKSEQHKGTPVPPLALPQSGTDDVQLTRSSRRMAIMTGRSMHTVRTPGGPHSLTSRFHGSSIVDDESAMDKPETELATLAKHVGSVLVTATIPSLLWHKRLSDAQSSSSPSHAEDVNYAIQNAERISVISPEPSLDAFDYLQGFSTAIHSERHKPATGTLDWRLQVCALEAAAQMEYHSLNSAGQHFHSNNAKQGLSSDQSLGWSQAHLQAARGLVATFQRGNVFMDHQFRACCVKVLHNNAQRCSKSQNLRKECHDKVLHLFASTMDACSNFSTIELILNRSVPVICAARHYVQHCQYPGSGERAANALMRPLSSLLQMIAAFYTALSSSDACAGAAYLSCLSLISAIASSSQDNQSAQNVFDLISQIAGGIPCLQKFLYGTFAGNASGRIAASSPGIVDEIQPLIPDEERQTATIPSHIQLMCINSFRNFTRSSVRSDPVDWSLLHPVRGIALHYLRRANIFERSPADRKVLVQFLYMLAECIQLTGSDIACDPGVVDCLLNLCYVHLAELYRSGNSENIDLCDAFAQVILSFCRRRDSRTSKKLLSLSVLEFITRESELEFEIHDSRYESAAAALSNSVSQTRDTMLAAPDHPSDSNDGEDGDIEDADGLDETEDEDGIFSVESSMSFDDIDPQSLKQAIQSACEELASHANDDEKHSDVSPLKAESVPHTDTIDKADSETHMSSANFAMKEPQESSQTEPSLPIHLNRLPDKGTAVSTGETECAINVCSSGGEWSSDDSLAGIDPAAYKRALLDTRMDLDLDQEQCADNDEGETAIGENRDAPPAAGADTTRASELGLKLQILAAPHTGEKGAAPDCPSNQDPSHSSEDWSDSSLGDVDPEAYKRALLETRMDLDLDQGLEVDGSEQVTSEQLDDVGTGNKEIADVACQSKTMESPGDSQQQHSPSTAAMSMSGTKISKIDVLSSKPAIQDSTEIHQQAASDGEWSSDDSLAGIDPEAYKRALLETRMELDLDHPSEDQQNATSSPLEQNADSQNPDHGNRGSDSNAQHSGHTIESDSTSHQGHQQIITLKVPLKEHSETKPVQQAGSDRGDLGSDGEWSSDDSLAGVDPEAYKRALLETRMELDLEQEQGEQSSVEISGTKSISLQSSGVASLNISAAVQDKISNSRCEPSPLSSSGEGKDGENIAVESGENWSDSSLDDVDPEAYKRALLETRMNLDLEGELAEHQNVGSNDTAQTGDSTQSRQIDTSIGEQSGSPASCNLASPRSLRHATPSISKNNHIPQPVHEQANQGSRLATEQHKPRNSQLSATAAQDRRRPSPSDVLLGSHLSPRQLVDDNQHYWLKRANRLFYKSAKLQATFLEIALALLVSPAHAGNALDPMFATDHPLENGSVNAPFVLFLHLNHPANAPVVHRLTRRLSCNTKRAERRLLKLLCQRLCDWSAYKKLSRVGQGAFGTVRKGLTADGRTVAIKELELPTTANDRQPIGDVFAEISAMEKLHGGSHSVGLVEYGVHARGWAIMMEWMPLSLSAWRRQLPKDPRECMPLLLSAYESCLHAISTCSNAGIAHFDIKGDNMLVRPTKALLHSSRMVQFDKEGQVEVALGDFGEAVSVANDRGVTSRGRGSEVIQAPEMLQIARARSTSVDSFDRRKFLGAGLPADAWSAACLLYEILFAEFLFQEDDWTAFYVRVTQDTMPILSESASRKLADYPELAGFLEFSLVRNPVRRPPISDMITRFLSTKEDILSQNRVLLDFNSHMSSRSGSIPVSSLFAASLSPQHEITGTWPRPLLDGSGREWEAHVSWVTKWLAVSTCPAVRSFHPMSCSVPLSAVFIADLPPSTGANKDQGEVAVWKHPDSVEFGNIPVFNVADIERGLREAFRVVDPPTRRQKASDCIVQLKRLLESLRSDGSIISMDHRGGTAAAATIAVCILLIKGNSRLVEAVVNVRDARLVAVPNPDTLSVLADLEQSQLIT